MILAAIFLATLSVLVVGYVAINRRTLTSADIARTRLAPEAPQRAWTLLKDQTVSDVPFIQKLMDGKEWSRAVQAQLLSAGVNQKPSVFILIWATCGVFASVLGSIVFENMLFFAGLAAFGWAAPWLWLRRKQAKRLKMFGEQLPDAIDMLVSAMKAGYSFQAATQFIGEEMIDPLGAEFARFYDEQRLGIDVKTALLNLQDRINSLDLKMFVTAVVIQRETGGNLSEVLSGLSDLIRSRMAIKGHIDTLTAEPKMSAKFLALIPVIVFFIIMAINPQFMLPMVASDGGKIALGAAAVSVVIGYMVMMKIADVDI